MLLTLVALGVGLVLAALLPALMGLVKSYVDLWIPVVIFVCGFAATVAVVFIFAILLGFTVNQKKPIKKPSRFFFFLYNLINSFLVLWSGARVVLKEDVKLDPSVSYFMVVNHRSKFDTMIMSVVYKKFKPLFVSKPENFKIIMAGPAIYKSGFMSMPKDDPKGAVKTVLKAVEYLKGGRSVGICPEGTRNKENRNLLPFKNGCFKIPMRARAPIAVFTIEGTQKIHKNFPFVKTLVYLDLIKVITPEEYEGLTTGELGNRVRQMMLDNIDTYGLTPDSVILAEKQDVINAENERLYWERRKAENEAKQRAAELGEDL